MLYRLTMWLYGFTFVGFVSLMGCSTTKPEVSSPLSRPTMGGESDRQSPVPAPSSSLAALQQGRVPASSPLKDIHFDFDHYDLRPDARAILRANADWLKANPSVRVEIEGHADERGTNEYNLALGAKRADSVRRYLIDFGIEPGRFSTVSYGEELPLCREHNESCWARNRRAHFATKTAPTS